MMKEIKDKMQIHLRKQNEIQIIGLKKEISQLKIDYAALMRSKDQLERKGKKVLFRPELQEENKYLVQNNKELNEKIVKFET